MGIDVTQYRTRIGLFACRGQKITTFSQSCGKDKSSKTTVVNIDYFLLAVFAALLLISGIEPNPGPKCPENDSRTEGNSETPDDTIVKDNIPGSVLSAVNIFATEGSASTSATDDMETEAFGAQAMEMEEIQIAHNGHSVNILQTANTATTYNVKLNVSVNNVQGGVQIGSQNEYTDGGTEKIQSSSSVLKYLMYRTKKEIEHFKKDPCITRKGVDALIQCLETSKMAVLTGICGEGKTTIAMHLLGEIKEGSHHVLSRRIPLKVNDPSEWMHVINTGQNVVIFIDDIFGSTNLNETLMRQWEQKLNDIGPDVEKGNILLIVTSRKHILVDASKLLRRSSYSVVTKTLFSEQNKIDLSSNFKLSTTEKRVFIQKCIDIQTNFEIRICGNTNVENITRSTLEKTIFISEKTIETIASIETSLGFLYLCSLFFSTKEMLSIGTRFFKKPNEFIHDQIDEMFNCDPFKYFVLVYTVLNNSYHTLKLSSRNLDPFKMTKTDEKTLRSIARACGVVDQDIAVSRIKQSADSLDGVFLRYNSITQSYVFSHQSVLETVSLHFGKKYPDIVVKHCTYGFLEEFVSVNGNRNSTDNLEMLVPESLYEALAERIYSFLKTSSNPERIINNRIMQDETFLCFLFRYMDQNGFFEQIALKTYPCYGRCSCRERNHIYRHSVAAYAAGNYQFLKAILERGILNGLYRYEPLLPCRNNQEQNHCDCYLLNAYKHGNLESIKLLVSYGLTIPERSLYLASSGNSELFCYIFEHRHWALQDITLALYRSCSMGTVDITTYLLKKGAELDEKCLPLAVDGGCTDMVYLMIENIKPADWEIPTLKHKACINRNLSILKLLNNKYPSYEPNLLQTAIICSRNNIDILKFLIETGVWLTEDKTNALNVSCKHGATNAIEYLFQNGAVCNDDTLRIAVKSGYLSIVKLIFKKFNWTPEGTKLSMNTACEKGNVDIVKYLHESSMCFPEEALSKAVKNGSQSLLQYVLQAKWSPDKLNEAMSEACKKCSFSSVKCLHEVGAHLDDNVFEYVSLNSKIFKFVISKGKWSQEQMQIALEVACLNSDMEMVKYLTNLEVCFTNKCLVHAASSGNIQKLSYVFENGEYSNESKRLALQNVCKKGHLDCVMYLHGKGICYSSECLRYCIKSLDIETVRFLLHSHKWHENELLESMDIACDTGQLDIVRLFRDNGINFSANGLLKAVSSRKDFVDFIFKNGTWTGNQIFQAIIEADKRENVSISEYLWDKLNTKHARQ